MHTTKRSASLATLAALAVTLVLPMFGPTTSRAGLVYNKEFYVPNVPPATADQRGGQCYRPGPI